MQSSTYRVRIKGARACFTRPEAKVERMSYEVMTPSAARGVLEAILWHPGITWVIEKIHILNPVKFEAIKRNETNGVCTMGGDYTKFFAVDQRTQRTTIYLKDVDYIVEAHFVVDPTKIPDREGIPKLSEAGNYVKFESMFHRRLEKHQHFSQPYLGCREFPANVEKAPATWETPIEFSYKSLGKMFKDFNYAGDMTNLMFDAIIRNGCMEIPA